jgi:hypothetical protein
VSLERRLLKGRKKRVSREYISWDIWLDSGTVLREGREGTRSAMGRGHTPGYVGKNKAIENENSSSQLLCNAKTHMHTPFS